MYNGDTVDSPAWVSYEVPVPSPRTPISDEKLLQDQL